MARAAEIVRLSPMAPERAPRPRLDALAAAVVAAEATATATSSRAASTASSSFGGSTGAAGTSFVPRLGSDSTASGEKR